MNKPEFRKYALKKRSELFTDIYQKDDADRQILKNLTESGLLNEISFVCTYVSYGSEADTRRIIEYLLSSGTKVAVPRCTKNGHMDFFFIKSMSELKPSFMGIPEPEYIAENLAADFSHSLCLVPGTAFDRKGNRTGYGGGYYDRFLGAEKEIITAGLCYQSLLFDEVPSDPHDISVDYIITEKGFFKINE